MDQFCWPLLDHFNWPLTTLKQKLINALENDDIDSFNIIIKKDPRFLREDNILKGGKNLFYLACQTASLNLLGEVLAKIQNSEYSRVKKIADYRSINEDNINTSIIHLVTQRFGIQGIKLMSGIFDYPYFEKILRSCSSFEDEVSRTNLNSLTMTIYDLAKDCNDNHHDEEALNYYKLAATYGNVMAQTHLARLYATGHGVERNLNEALRLFQLAMKQGDESARRHFNLLLQQIYGQGLKCQDDEQYEEAFKFFELAAEYGCVDAQYNLAACYESAQGVQMDMMKAIDIYVLAAQQNSLEALARLGSLFEEGLTINEEVIIKQNYAIAFSFHQLAADKGFVYSQNCVAHSFANGLGTAKNYSEALRYCKLAVAKGDEFARTRLNEYIDDIYAEAEKCEKNKNYEDAFKYYELCANSGDARAQCNLAKLYGEGLGVNQNFTEALILCKLSKDNGNEAAKQYFRSLCFKINTLGIQSKNNGNYVEALDYFNLTAAYGSSSASNSIGAMYKEGLGVKADYGMAFYHYKLAAEQGNEQAKLNLNNLLKDIKNLIDTLKNSNQLDKLNHFFELYVKVNEVISGFKNNVTTKKKNTAQINQVQSQNKSTQDVESGMVPIAEKTVLQSDANGKVNKSNQVISSPENNLQTQNFFTSQYKPPYLNLNDACRNAKTDTVKLLIQGALNSYGGTNSPQFKKFLEEKNYWGFTPLNAACNELKKTTNDEKITALKMTIQILIRYDANPDIENHQQFSARENLPKQYHHLLEENSYLKSKSPDSFFKNTKSVRSNNNFSGLKENSNLPPLPGSDMEICSNGKNLKETDHGKHKLVDEEVEFSNKKFKINDNSSKTINEPQMIMKF